MADNQYRILLGTQLDTSDIAAQINKAESKIDPIKIKVDAETKELTKTIQDALKGLSSGTKNALTLDTSGFESSIADIKSAVVDLKKVLGSLDDSANMKSLLASVNQIANAIGKVTDESETLAKSLSAISKKDFGFNFNLKTGNANPLKAATDYGKEARRNAIPLLQEQASALQDLLGGYMQADKALERYLTKIHKVSGISIKNSLIDDMSNTGSIAKQMEAIEKYIGYLKKIAVEKNIDLSGFDAQFSKAAENIVDDTVKIQTGAKQTEEALEAVSKEMKQVFGGGIGAEQLSAQLDPIVSDLNQIREAVVNLSKGVSLEGITSSFDRLSNSIENLLANAEKVKGVLNSGFDVNTIGGDIDSIKSPKSSRSKTQSEINSKINGYLNEWGIKDSDRKTVRSKIDAFAKVSSLGAGDELYEAALSDLMNTVKQLGSVSKNASDDAKTLLATLKGYKIDAPKDKYKQEFGDDWKGIKSKYKILRSGTGLPVDTAYQELSSTDGFSSYFPDDIWNEYDQLRKIIEVYDKLEENSKNRKVGISEEYSDATLKAEVLDIVDTLQDQARLEQEVAQASTQSANIIAQNENKKRQEYEQTIQQIAQAEEAIQEFENRINNPTSTDFDGATKEIQGYQMAIDNLEQYKSELVSKANALGEELQIDKLDSFKNSLQSIGMDTDAIDNVTNRIQNLGVQIDTLDQKRTTSGNKDILSVDISGVDEFGNAIKLTEQYNAATGELIKTVDRVSTVQQKAGTVTDSFVKQQKTAVSNLTNQINQMNRAANDPNASRPIKDTSHLDSLKSKYNEIISAIERMENASSDTFVDEQNNVRKLISEYKSLVSEYKNAENVSTKMKGTDFGSGLDIAKNDLEKFKAEAKDFPQITATVRELDKAIEGVGDAASLNKFNDQLRVARSELARVKSETTALNRSEKVGINVSGLESKIADIQRISPEIDKFETEIDGAKVSVQSLLNDLKQVKTQGDFSVVNARFKAFADAAKAAGIAVAETAQKAKSINDIKIKLSDTGFNGFEQEVLRVRNAVDELEGVYPDLEAALKRLDTAMEGVYSADQAGDVKRLVAANEEYEASLKQVHSQLKLYQQAEKNAYNAEILKQKKSALSSEMKSWLKENTRAAKDFGEEIRRLDASLDGLDDKGVKLVGQQFKAITKQAQAMGKTGLTTFDRLKSKAKEYMSYLSAAEMFMYAEQAFRSMFEQVKLIDSAMTELKKVTDESDASYNKFLSNAATRSKELGTTIDGLVSSTADFARLGYGFKDAQGLAEVANIYAVVGDEIEGVEGATESLVSTMAAFKDELSGVSDTDFAMDIIDKFNEVSNNFAISSGGIGEAMQRSASSLRAANNTIDESIALITAANTVVVLCHAA